MERRLDNFDLTLLYASTNLIIFINRKHNFKNLKCSLMFYKLNSIKVFNSVKY